MARQAAAAPITPSAPSPVEQFAANRYLVLPGAVKPSLLEVCFRHAMSRAAFGDVSPDRQVPETPAVYGDPIMDMLLTRLLPDIERASGLRLYPTYSYFRVYGRGDVLKRHTDRPACEVSVSVNLGPAQPVAWPLWIEGPHGIAAVDMSPGDAVLYRGIECPHWREAFPGDQFAQVFLHYVDQAGPHAGWKYDGRHSLVAC